MMTIIITAFERSPDGGKGIELHQCGYDIGPYPARQ